MGGVRFQGRAGSLFSSKKPSLPLSSSSPLPTPLVLLLSCRMDGLILSNRTVHLLNGSPELLATLRTAPAHAGAHAEASASPSSLPLIVAEGARNVPNLTAEQKSEFSRKVMGLCSAAGAVILGSDRQISADTYAVGTVLSLAAGEEGKEAGKKEAVSGSGSGTSQAFTAQAPFTLLPAVAAAEAAAQSQWQAAAAGGKAESESKAPKAKPRCKLAGMSAYSQPPMPHLLLQQLQKLEEREGSSTLPQELARSNISFALSLRSHDWQGGDNPLPESFVAAYSPSCSSAVGEAYLQLLKEREGSTNGAAGGAASISAGGAAAGK